MARQLSLIKTEVQYGGTHTQGKAKVRRPLSTKKPLHVTLRSSKAVGGLSLLRHRRPLEQLMARHADKWGVRIYKSSINGNHIHLVVRGVSRSGIQNFFRAFAGIAARTVSRAQKGKPFGKFWDEVLWSRVAEWGQAFAALKGYIVRNVLEASGTIPYNRAIRTSDVLRL